MKSIGMALAGLIVASGASAYPMDIEHNARWLVLDGLPQWPGGAPSGMEVTQLRTRDFPDAAFDLAAVCGTLGSDDAGDGAANFVVLYARDATGAIGPVGRPFFYGALSDDNPQQRVARMACGEPEPAPAVLKASR